MYCGRCGSKVEEKDLFCSSCGARRADRKEVKKLDPTEKGVKSPKKKRSGILFLISILLLLLGLQYLALDLAGQESLASLSSVRQDKKTYGESMPDPNRYRIEYTFNHQSKSYSGSASMIFKRGVKSGQKILVAYLPLYPSINSPAEKSTLSAGFFLTLLGIILMVHALRAIFGIRGRSG